MIPEMPITIEELIGKPWKIYMDSEALDFEKPLEVLTDYMEFFYSDEFGLLFGQTKKERSLLAESSANERYGYCIPKPDFLFTFVTKKGKVNVKCEDVQDPKILELERKHSVFSLVRVKAIRFWTYAAMNLVELSHKSITGAQYMDELIKLQQSTGQDDPHYKPDMDEILSILKWSL